MEKENALIMREVEVEEERLNSGGNKIWSECHFESMCNGWGWIHGNGNYEANASKQDTAQYNGL